MLYAILILNIITILSLYLLLKHHQHTNDVLETMTQILKLISKYIEVDNEEKDFKAKVQVKAVGIDEVPDDIAKQIKEHVKETVKIFEKVKEMVTEEELHKIVHDYKMSNKYHLVAKYIIDNDMKFIRTNTEMPASYTIYTSEMDVFTTGNIHSIYETINQINK